MGRVDKNRQLRYQLIEERDNFKTIYGEVIEHNLDIINDKLDDISSTLEELSKHLYETDIPEFDDEELEEEDIDYLLDLEFESFRESEREYESNLNDE